MLSHRQVQLEFDAYATGSLPAVTVAAVESHLAGCDPCRAAWTSHRAVTATLAGLPVHDPGTAFTESVLAALPAARPAPQAAGAPWWIPLGLVALAVVVIASGSPAATPNAWTVAIRNGLAWWNTHQHLVLREVNLGVAHLPWEPIRQGLWATALGLLIAFGIPAGRELVWARRRIHGANR